MSIGSEPNLNLPAQQTGERITHARILLAEDTPIWRKNLKRYLESLNYKVKVVENGKLLLDELSAGEYDIIITDQNMPEMTGIEALKVIRSTTQKRDLPVIVLTAGNSELQSVVEEAGGIYLGKERPDLSTKLQSTIKDLMKDAN